MTAGPDAGDVQRCAELREEEWEVIQVSNSQTHGRKLHEEDVHRGLLCV